VCARAAHGYIIDVCCRIIYGGEPTTAKVNTSSHTHVVIKLPYRQQALSLKITPGNKYNWKYFSSRPAEGGKRSKKICAHKERKYAPLLCIVANEKAFNLISLNKA
jgi:hypothetical protein